MIKNRVLFCNNSPGFKERSILSDFSVKGATDLSYNYGPGYAKTCLMLHANNKRADQPAHPRSLISTFVVRCLDSIWPLVSVSEISTL